MLVNYNVWALTVCFKIVNFYIIKTLIIGTREYIYLLPPKIPLNLFVDSHMSLVSFSSRVAALCVDVSWSYSSSGPGCLKAD